MATVIKVAIKLVLKGRGLSVNIDPEDLSLVIEHGDRILGLRNY
jgi:hypothetical protein